MAKIIPFKGIFYNPDKTHNLGDVTIPPYDVISEQEQLDFHNRHPYNIIRLTLGKQAENDTNKNNWHTRAAGLFNDWLSKNILVRDNSPSLYLTSVEFSSENKTITRYGLIALVGLEPFNKGIIIPHEKTFSKVTAERFELIKACHANFSPIFGIYSDQNDILGSLKDAAGAKVPDMEFIDSNSLKHRLWRITDTSMHSHITDAMKEKKLLIADGHHRYETALKYKKRISEIKPGFSADHPANYVMMYLSSMEDPGLIILPAHRMLKKVQDSDLETFIQKAENYFEITTIPFDEKSREKARVQFISALRLNNSKNIIGVFIKNRQEFYLLRLKPQIMKQMFGKEISASLINLDVTVLTRLILMEILGFDQSMLDNEKLIAYSSSEEKAIQEVASGRCDITFILNPTKINQVREIAQQGLIMPRKSTYFYPKVITGQVINRLIH
ncbi:MAG: DUF1015 domain-containing protein [Desulfobacteraceae bacterium]|uniref:DUF1015 domain-containing protein n=1 Tax=Candidatus Desulfaltia bathyphila TaxID=2841697 RepID=A0A8J6N6N2_9BACT|nr:DUF1015 domain-containing protein [Candidatus Desulfaltia bathyphila]MBL7195170.1 DUF1015 domain-containing protein [Desulfobacterales bacterium]